MTIASIATRPDHIDTSSLEAKIPLAIKQLCDYTFSKVLDSFCGYYYIPSPDSYGTGLYMRQQRKVLDKYRLPISLSLHNANSMQIPFPDNFSNQPAIFISSPRGSQNTYQEVVNALSVRQDIDGGSQEAKKLLNEQIFQTDPEVDNFHIHPTALSIATIAGRLLSDIDSAKILMPGGGGNTGTVTADLFRLMGADVHILGRGDIKPFGDYVANYAPDLIVSLVPPMRNEDGSFQESFAIGSLSGYSGGIIDVTTWKGSDGKNRGSFDLTGKSNNIDYIPSVGNVGTLTTLFLILNYLRALMMAHSKNSSSSGLPDLATMNTEVVTGKFAR